MCAENAGAIHHHVDAGTAQLLQRDQLHLVDAAQRVRHRPHADHPHHLRERLAVRLDVVRPPQHDGDGLRVLPVILALLRRDEAVDHHLGGLHSRQRRPPDCTQG